MRGGGPKCLGVAVSGCRRSLWAACCAAWLLRKARACSSRRMNLPLYVSGSATATMNLAGTATELRRLCTSERSRPSSDACSEPPGCKTTKATGLVPSTSSGMSTTATLRSGEPAGRSVSASSALSISSVPMRLPPTLITSSERPWMVYAPPSWRTAVSPCTYSPPEGKYLAQRFTSPCQPAVPKPSVHQTVRPVYG